MLAATIVLFGVLSHTDRFIIGTNNSHPENSPATPARREQYPAVWIFGGVLENLLLGEAEAASCVEPNPQHDRIN